MRATDQNKNHSESEKLGNWEEKCWLQKNNQIEELRAEHKQFANFNVKMNMNHAD